MALPARLQTLLDSSSSGLQEQVLEILKALLDPDTLEGAAGGRRLSRRTAKTKVDNAQISSPRRRLHSLALACSCFGALLHTFHLARVNFGVHTAAQRATGLQGATR